MPSMSDGFYQRSGPPTYIPLIEPPKDRPKEGLGGRYPDDRFPAFAALATATKELPVFGDHVDDLKRSFLEMQFGAALDCHFNKFGEVVADLETARSVVLPPVRALLDDDLDIALLAPVALTRFDFRAVRLTPNIFLMKMSPALQRARWSSKAYGGAKGHDSVLAAATHAFVVTGWRIDNHGYMNLSHSLARPWPNATEELDRIFAAFRLVTGIETGYAQEVRLARGWRIFGQAIRPDVSAAPARKYPEAFDDFAWTRDDLPSVTKDQMRIVGDLLQQVGRLNDPRLALAMRRLNAAATRGDPSDAILDAVIGLEILLGDKNNESISWKLRMRAAALAGLEADRAEMQKIYDEVSAIYTERSVTVHGLKRKAGARNAEDARQLAIEILRRILGLIIRNPRFLDPIKIDQELMLNSPFGSNS